MGKFRAFLRRFLTNTLLAIGMAFDAVARRCVLLSIGFATKPKVTCEGIDLAPFGITEKKMSVWRRVMDDRYDYPAIFDSFSSPMGQLRVVDPVSLEAFLNTFACKDLVESGEISTQLVTNLKTIVDDHKRWYYNKVRSVDRMAS